MVYLLLTIPITLRIDEQIPSILVATNMTHFGHHNLSHRNWRTTRKGKTLPDDLIPLQSMIFPVDSLTLVHSHHSVYHAFCERILIHSGALIDQTLQTV